MYSDTYGGGVLTNNIKAFNRLCGPMDIEPDPFGCTKTDAFIIATP